MDQFQIPDKSSGKGIFDGDDHAVDISRVVGRQHLLETVKTQQFHRDVLIECHGGFLVEAAPTSQNRDFFHSSVHKKGPSSSGRPNIHLYADWIYDVRLLSLLIIVLDKAVDVKSHRFN